VSSVNWLYTKRSILQGTVQQDIESLDRFDVIYVEPAELLRSNVKSWLFLQRMMHHQRLVLWANVQQDSSSHWLAYFAMASTVADIVRRRQASLILHTPTDPIYLDWAKEMGAKCVQSWLAFPFARQFEKVKRAPAIAGKQWRLTANGSVFDELLKEAANSGIMVFGQNDDVDARLSKLAAASSLRHIPIMLKDESTFWRIVTHGGKDCSIYASVPLALDEDAMTLLTNTAVKSWRKFRRTWLQAWSSWAEKMREFWDEQILRERFADEVGLILPDDLTPIHHFYLLDAGR
jgi:hypothetical protein